MTLDSKLPVEGLYLEKVRISTFKKWPHKTPSAEKMAEAGFVHCPNKKEPDLAQCYFCNKSLDCWESDDNPWTSHYKNCEFSDLGKPQNEQTLQEYVTLECERLGRKAEKQINECIENFDKQEVEVRKELMKLVSKS